MFHKKTQTRHKRVKSSQLLANQPGLPNSLLNSITSRPFSDVQFKIEETSTKAKRTQSFQDLLTLKRNSEQNKNQQVFTVYFIRVVKPHTRRSWLVSKRYSEFHELHKHLIKHYETVSASTNSNSNNNESSQNNYDYSTMMTHNRIEVPSIPPKLVFGNMKEINISKRLLGLQAFLDGISNQSAFYDDSEVIQFFDLMRDEKHIIYQLSDVLHRKIFQFLTFTDIFPVLTNVCKWWRDIIFSSFQNVKMVSVNKNVFFGNIPVNIDLITEAVSFITWYCNHCSTRVSFKQITVLRLEQFYDLTDSMLDTIFDNCKMIEDLTLVSCSLQRPTIVLQHCNIVRLEDVMSSNSDNNTFAVTTNTNTTDSARSSFSSSPGQKPILDTNQLTTTTTALTTVPSDALRSRSNSNTPSGFMRCINLSYCELMTSITFSGLKRNYPFDNENLLELDLTGTAITDEGLMSILERLNHLKVLLLKECRHLIEPHIVNSSLEHLNMRFSRNLSAPIICCPMLDTLDLAYTAVTDEVIQTNISQQPTSANLRVLSLSNCSQLNCPSFTQQLVSPTNDHNNAEEVGVESVEAMYPTTAFTCYVHLEELYLDCCAFLTLPVIQLPSLKLLDLRITKQLNRDQVTRDLLQEHCSSLIHLRY